MATMLVGAGLVAGTETRIDLPTVYTDGSGAPALVDKDGWRFACDMLGTPRVNLLNAVSGRKPPRWLAGWVEKAYLAALRTKATPEWFAANRAMYGATS